MKSIFYVVSVLLDDNNQPVIGSEEAIGLLTNSKAIDEALEIQREKRLQDTVTNCHVFRTIQ